MVITCLMSTLWSHAEAQPPSKGREYYEARGDIVWEVPTDEKIIALTFDDGPDPSDTPEILDLLNQYGAKATFFVIGKRVEKYPDLVKREVGEGHEIANHTYSHPYFKKRIPGEKVQDEILKAEQIILDTTGLKPSLFRPPGGYYGENLVNASKKSGYLVVMWSWHQDTEDWNRPGVTKIVNKVLTNARNGDIILFHDYVEGKSQTVEALKQILPQLKERGYRFVTVSELLDFRKSTTVEN
ncbi:MULTISPECIES: polysaccharide deacetylase family protein [unclassified Paenibacillus]|uniref:polysaccharide deacetylase family protein n=1 Tax=unclassified Paenibacillus TaxID=185978 RepID=UPI001FD7AA41|nr:MULTISPECIES: polysaccharide deacetylase family protein [unclassified Paenibacillus]